MTPAGSMRTTQGTLVTSRAAANLARESIPQAKAGFGPVISSISAGALVEMPTTTNLSANCFCNALSAGIAFLQAALPTDQKLATTYLPWTEGFSPIHCSTSIAGAGLPRKDLEEIGSARGSGGKANCVERSRSIWAARVAMV